MNPDDSTGRGILFIRLKKEEITYVSNPLQALCDAAADNDLESANSIIAATPNVLKPNPKPDPPEGEAAPYQVLGVGKSPLMSAVDGNHIEMVRLLLKHGADPDEHHGYNYGMPLQAAIWKNRFEIAHLLLDHGADPSKSTAMADMEATGYSLFCGNTDLVNRIFAAGGRADIFAYIKANMLPVLGELLDHCPDVPANNPSIAGTRTILAAIRDESAWCGNADSLSMALAVRPITEAQFKNGVGAAIQSHNRLFPVESYLRCFTMLLNAGAEFIGDANFCPLHKLARKNRIEGRIEFAKLFVERGVDPAKPHFKSGKTVLEEAREHERHELVEYLESL